MNSMTREAARQSETLETDASGNPLSSAIRRSKPRRCYNRIHPSLPGSQSHHCGRSRSERDARAQNGRAQLEPVMDVTRKEVRAHGSGFI